MCGNAHGSDEHPWQAPQAWQTHQVEAEQAQEQQHSEPRRGLEPEQSPATAQWAIEHEKAKRAADEAQKDLMRRLVGMEAKLKAQEQSMQQIQRKEYETAERAADLEQKLHVARSHIDELERDAFDEADETDDDEEGEDDKLHARTSSRLQRPHPLSTAVIMASRTALKVGTIRTWIEWALPQLSVNAQTWRDNQGMTEEQFLRFRAMDPQLKLEDEYMATTIASALEPTSLRVDNFKKAMSRQAKAEREAGDRRPSVMMSGYRMCQAIIESERLKDGAMQLTAIEEFKSKPFITDGMSYDEYMNAVSRITTSQKSDIRIPKTVL